MTIRNSFLVSRTLTLSILVVPRLLQVESNWLDPAGIPGRPRFRHLL